MIRVFVAHTSEDASCAEHIRQDLEARGYTIWRQPTTVQVSDILYPRTIETIILGSAVVLLVWSKSAAHSEWIERQVLFAQQLRKPLLALVRDATTLPQTVVTSTTVLAQAGCTDIVAHLVQQSLLPAPESTDSLIVLSEQTAHEFIRERKAAIDQAVQMFTRNEHREEVLCILEYLAHYDQMNGVREKAQEALDADHARQSSHTPTPFFHPNDSRHMFGVRCKNGHVI